MVFSIQLLKEWKGSISVELCSISRSNVGKASCCSDRARSKVVCTMLLSSQEFVLVSLATIISPMLYSTVIVYILDTVASRDSHHLSIGKVMQATTIPFKPGGRVVEISKNGAYPWMPMKRGC